jgi:hypothetical protein
VKADESVDAANRTSVSDQQFSWAQLYEKRMRRFNVIVVFVAITSLSIVWWLVFK